MQKRFIFAASLAALAGCHGNDPKGAHKPLENMKWVVQKMGDTVKPGAATGVTAPCPKGMQPISGAGRYSATTGTEFLVEQSQPFNGGWLFSVRNQTNATVQVQVQALVLCGDQIPPAPPF